MDRKSKYLMQARIHLHQSAAARRIGHRARGFLLLEWAAQERWLAMRQMGLM